MKLAERVRALLGTVYTAYRGMLQPKRRVRVPDQQLKREEIQEGERQKALRELDRLRNQPPEH